MNERRDQARRGGRRPAGAPRRPAPPTAGAPAPGARAPGPPPMGVEPPAAGRRPPVAAPPAAAGGPVRPAEPAVRPAEPADRHAPPALGAAPRPLGAAARGPAQRRPAAGPQGLAERPPAAVPRKAAPRPVVAGRRGAVGGPARLAGPAGPRKAVPLAGASGLERAAGVQGRASAARTRRDGGLGPMRTRAVRLGAAGRATAGLALATVDQGRPARPARPGSRSGSTSRGGEGTRARDRGREPVGGREATGGGVPAGLEAESAAEDAPKVSEVLTEADQEAAVAAGREAKGSAPRSAAVRELLGISLYQVGEYKAARTELAAAQRISGNADLTAMLADVERATGRPEQAIELLRTTDRTRMSADTAAELLVVAAYAYGDMGQPAAGVALIRRHARWPAQLADHHLRLAYTEGALAERAGDLDAATEAFARVTRTDPGFFDAAERLERLKRAAPD